MESIRKPFQGVSNIIRFNWHFYVMAIFVILLCLLFIPFVHESLRIMLLAFIALLAIPVLGSLLVSYYVYDVSGLYKLSWIAAKGNQNILHITAGFDETSAILKAKFPAAQLVNCDFYNADRHTEVSIKRARLKYPLADDCMAINSTNLPFEDSSFDLILAIFSVHEIRDQEERILFFKQLHRVLSDDGTIQVTEHLRDLPNFLAYQIGFFHFYSLNTWKHTFAEAGFALKSEIKVNPFVSTFNLKKVNHGNPS